MINQELKVKFDLCLSKYLNKSSVVNNQNSLNKFIKSITDKVDKIITKAASDGLSEQDINDSFNAAHAELEDKLNKTSGMSQQSVSYSRKLS